MKKLLFLAIFMTALNCFAGQVSLSHLEKSYIRMLGTVKVCVDPDWYPFERVGNNGEYEGIAADLLRLVGERTGIKFELYRTKDWDESIQASKDHQCQILSFLNETPERDKWLLFTNPQFTDVNVFITREQHSFISNPSNLTNETIVFPEGTAMEELVKKRYPNLRIIRTESEDQAFQMVSDKKADMTMRSLIVAAYTIKKEGLFNLKISGQLPDFTNQLRIGVIKTEPMLVPILNKGIASISNLEREQIVNRHISIKAVTAVDYKMIMNISLFFLFFAALSLYWLVRLKKLNDKLKKLSETDILTGLYNRTKLNQRFSEEMERAVRYGRPLSVIMLDIDHFKLINDKHGHLGGDAVLKRFATLALDNVRGCDILGRWGGEEFLIICQETSLADAYNVAERIKQAVVDKSRERSCGCTVSAGIAVLMDGDTEDSLLARADESLYCAKDSGRNRVCGV